MQGKSLSLICGALSWLTDFEEKRRRETAALLEKGEEALSAASQSSSCSSAEPDWVTDFVQKKTERDLVSKLKVKMSYFRVDLHVWLNPRVLNQDEELKRRKREKRLEMIRGNVQLKYAMKRKVSDTAQEQQRKKTTKTLKPCSLCEFQSCEDDEAFQLLQLSKGDEPEERGDEGDEDLIVAEYQSDDESKPRSR